MDRSMSTTSISSRRTQNTDNETVASQHHMTDDIIWCYKAGHRVPERVESFVQQ
jgi:hypothetical protein